MIKVVSKEKKKEEHFVVFELSLTEHSLYCDAHCLHTVRIND